MASTNHTPPSHRSTEPDQFYMDFLQETRFWVQRVLCPIVIVIGVIGNGLTIIVMTRKRMRSSTNCYLAALASVDMAYLLFTFALSLKHYPGWRHPKFAAYWHSLPVIMMLADACTNISVWLTATFTLERFVVVSHPIRGKVICTESRAKKTCAAIFTFCLLFVLPTPFEWTIVEQVDETVTSELAGNSTYKVTYLAMYPSEFGQNQTYKSVYYWLTAVLFIFIPVLTLIIFNTFLIRSVRNSRRQRTQMTQSKYTPASLKPTRSAPVTTSGPAQTSTPALAKSESTYKEPNNNNNNNGRLSVQYTSGSNCHGNGKDAHLPVTTGNTANSSRSSSPGANQSRHASTATVAACGTSGTSGTSGAHVTHVPNRIEQQSAKQETKITIMLISVVFLFLICQLPVACSLIYTSIRELDASRNEFYIVTTINNIINLMVAVNAAGNFVLYCLLSQKYRRTLVALICPCIKNRLPRFAGQNMTQTVVYSTSGYSQQHSYHQHPQHPQHLQHPAHPQAPYYSNSYRINGNHASSSSSSSNTTTVAKRPSRVNQQQHLQLPRSSITLNVSNQEPGPETNQDLDASKLQCITYSTGDLSDNHCSMSPPLLSPVATNEPEVPIDTIDTTLSSDVSVSNQADSNDAQVSNT